MRLRKALLTVVAWAVALVLAEAALRLAAPPRSLGPAFSVFDPVLGKRLKRGFRCVRITPEFRMRFSTNSLGFRGPEPPLPLRRPLVFLGDSFTLGYGVDDGEEFPERVRRALNVPGINAGVGNSGNGRWVKWLEREAAQWEPRLVLLQMCSNDFADNAAEQMFALGPSGELRELAPPPRTAARVVQRALEAVPGLSYSYLVGWLQQAAAGRPAGRAGAADSDRLTYRLIEEALGLCRARGWPVIGLSADLQGECLERVRALFARLGAGWIEAPAKARRPDLYYRVDGHWNSAGHAAVADLVIRRLRPLQAASARSASRARFIGADSGSFEPFE